jgi:EAL domain-containing protein (putative c-di-GMP-specific phosphodiesterase class I)
VVAEGIETTAQEAYLLAIGCDMGQGFLYSSAVSADVVPACLSEFNIVDRIAKAG